MEVSLLAAMMREYYERERDGVRTVLCFVEHNRRGLGMCDKFYEDLEREASNYLLALQELSVKAFNDDVLRRDPALCVNLGLDAGERQADDFGEEEAARRSGVGVKS